MSQRVNFCSPHYHFMTSCSFFIPYLFIFKLYFEPLPDGECCCDTPQQMPVSHRGRGLPQHEGQQQSSVGSHEDIHTFTRLYFVLWLGILCSLVVNWACLIGMFRAGDWKFFNIYSIACIKMIFLALGY